MNCPNCAHSFQKQIYSGVHVMHCGYCGYSMFNTPDINTITLEDADALSQNKTIEFSNANQKYDPIDNTPLSKITNNSSIPGNVTLLKNESGTRIFADPSELVTFKRGQISHISVKPSITKTFAALRPAFSFAAMFLFAVGVSGYMMLQTLPNAPKSEADEMLPNIFIQTTNASQNQIYVYFVTSEPYISTLKLHNPESSEIITVPISITPNTMHTLTTRDIPTNTLLNYTVELINEANVRFETSPKPFSAE